MNSGERLPNMKQTPPMIAEKWSANFHDFGPTALTFYCLECVMILELLNIIFAKCH